MKGLLSAQVVLHSEHPDELYKLLSVVDKLGKEELKVLEVLAKRLLTGQERYAKLNLSKDTRDLIRERAEEFADALIYGAMEEVRKVLT